MPFHKVLVVDDDKLLQESIKDVLIDKYDITIAGSGEAAIQVLKTHPIDLVLLDIRLPGMDGIDTLRHIREEGFEVTVIMMTAYEDIKSVITTMKMGAFDYLVKPLDIDELEVIIEKALENLHLKRELHDIHKQKAKEFNIENIIGRSPGMKAAMKMAGTISQSYDTTVLLEGETGTGKEVVAKTIHYSGNRMKKPFVGINCGAISKDLVESELFGYEKGTFTGGLKSGKKGKCEMADGGTLFLDEISELALSAQVKLLRFLEEKEFYRVGGTDKITVDVRVIAATNQSLEEGIKNRTFREDLYYRLNVAKILLPPLRERKEDIIPLTMLFMDQFNEKFQKKFCGVSTEAGDALLNHWWGGNVRELRNTVERIILMENDSSISLDHLWFLKNAQKMSSDNGPQVHEAGGNIHGGVNLTEFNRHLIQQALDKSGGNKARAAKSLGISRSQLIYRLKKMSE
ncbi:MAG: sigma-54 dependent transcriptional regulator [Syntrophales bacterium]|nr:sigma-54 dependent transcriptional regulator [Syntrophales bacterium]